MESDLRKGSELIFILQNNGLLSDYEVQESGQMEIMR